MANPRSLKRGEQIKVIAAEMLEKRIKDPRLGFVTLTDVRMSKDGSDAVLFYTVLGGEQEAADTAAALEAARGQIRTQVSKQLGMRFAPTITFTPDAMPEASRQIEELLARARSTDAEVAAASAGAAYAGEADPYKRADEEGDHGDALVTSNHDDALVMSDHDDASLANDEG